MFMKIHTGRTGEQNRCCTAVCEMQVFKHFAFVATHQSVSRITAVIWLLFHLAVVVAPMMLFPGESHAPI